MKKYVIVLFLFLSLVPTSFSVEASELQDIYDENFMVHTSYSEDTFINNFLNNIDNMGYDLNKFGDPETVGNEVQIAISDSRDLFDVVRVIDNYEDAGRAPLYLFIPLEDLEWARKFSSDSVKALAYNASNDMLRQIDEFIVNQATSSNEDLEYATLRLVDNYYVYIAKVSIKPKYVKLEVAHRDKIEGEKIYLYP